MSEVMPTASMRSRHARPAVNHHVRIRKTSSTGHLEHDCCCRAGNVECALKCAAARFASGRVSHRKNNRSRGLGPRSCGQPLPEYMESGECLFCHRNEVGVTWAKNKHNRTIRDADPKEPSIAALHADPKAKEVAEQVELIMGDTRSNRFLKRAAAYGKLDLLSVAAALSRTGRARLDHADNPHWDTDIFAQECAAATPPPSIPRHTPLRRCRWIVLPAMATRRSSTPTTAN